MVKSLPSTQIKFATWKHDDGHVLVILFNNGTSVAVSVKVFKTVQGALAFGAKITARCSNEDGPWGKANLPWYTCDAETGERTEHFTCEATGDI